MENHAVLILADGTTLFGKSAGVKSTAVGEICFNTGMTGYQEIFTDTSYHGQLMVTTNSHIGNYGVQNLEAQSEKVKISGLICKDFNDNNSRPASSMSLQDYFAKEGLVAISSQTFSTAFLKELTCISTPALFFIKHVL